MFLQDDQVEAPSGHQLKLRKCYIQYNLDYSVSQIHAIYVGGTCILSNCLTAEKLLFLCCSVLSKCFAFRWVWISRQCDYDHSGKCLVCSNNLTCCACLEIELHVDVVKV